MTRDEERRMYTGIATEGAVMHGPTHEQLQQMEYKLRQASPESRESQIQTECTKMGENTEVLLKLLSELKIRLNPVLRPETDAPTRNSENEKSPDSLAPLADFLKSRNYLIKIAITDITAILNRIEL